MSKSSGVEEMQDKDKETNKTQVNQVIIQGQLQQ